jgi:AraC-like DNA-binding protein
VQYFTCRHRQWKASAGKVFMLSPGEAHDGYANVAEGFGYSAACIDAELIQQALGGRSLPSLMSPLINLDPQQFHSLAPLWQVGKVLGEGEISESIAVLADIVSAVAGESRRLPLAALSRTREFIRASPHRPIALSELERVSGLDRWTLARSFRQAYGVSPTRYRTMRQLMLARALMLEGQSLAATAADAGFADQSHMSRKFKSAFGVTPALWRNATDSLSHKRSIRRTSSPDRL